MREDLQALPRVADSISYVYAERCRVEQDDKAIVLIDQKGRRPVPCASLLLLMLGPGSVITHAAMQNLAACGCTVAWAGEGGVRMYASGVGATRSARNLLHQARLVSNDRSRLDVVRAMYQRRFPDILPVGLSLPQIRGREGVRVRQAYARESERTGVPWFGRSYKRDDWRASDAVNQALTAANQCLYGVVHAALVAAGYSPALGFIHTGHQLSFVFDIADLYKTETSIPAAFDVVEQGSGDPGRDVRALMRDRFVATRMLARIVKDTFEVLGAAPDSEEPEAAPDFLWAPDGLSEGGVNWADASSRDDQGEGTASTASEAVE